MTIAAESAKSLILSLRARGRALSIATGFIVEHDRKHYLITNWHVLSGRRPDTGQPQHSSGALPDEVTISYLLPQTQPGVLKWEERTQPLIDTGGGPLWLEHPVFRRQVDVAALEITTASGAHLIPYSLNDSGPVLGWGVSEFVSVIGFPFGFTAGGRLAVWTKGSVASEPDIDFNGLPSFLIDARTRAGQSGSPVILYAAGGMVNMADGSSAVFSGPVSNFLGIYSGRINSESDLGVVWRSSVISEILSSGIRGDTAFMPITP